MSSLFDALNEEEPDDDTLPEWQEVPQALFLSWSEAMQRSYCAARDLDSAMRETDPEMAEFYLNRAKSYQL